MDHEIAVGVRHRGQHVEKQPDALLDAQIVALAVLIDGLAPHIFQDEVRLAIAFDTGIQQMSDVRMLQAGQHASLAREALLRRMPDESRVQELDRHLSFEPAIAAMCEPDGAHAAEPERPLQRVRAESTAFETGRQLAPDRIFQVLAFGEVCDLRSGKNGRARPAPASAVRDLRARTRARWPAAPLPHRAKD